MVEGGLGLRGVRRVEGVLWGMDTLGIVLVEDRPWRAGGGTFVVDGCLMVWFHPGATYTRGRHGWASCPRREDRCVSGRRVSLDRREC